MITIPKQLQNDEYKFILIAKKNKIPLELEWQNTNNYYFDSEKVVEHLKNGGNYGVICGGGLIVMDADTPEFNEIVKKNFPETYTVKTSKGHHYYFETRGFEKKKVLKDGSNHLGEIQSTGSFVVGANCIHPTGVSYELVKDIPISKIDSEKINEVLGKFYSSDRINKEVITKGTGSGLRNDSMFKLACSFREKDLTPEECLTTLIGINQKNSPPLPERELQMVVDSAYKYEKKSKPKNGSLKLDNYVDNVELFYEKHPFFFDKGNIWWLWNKKDLKYEMIDEVDILNEIDDQLNFYGQAITNKFRGNYLNAFKSVGRRRIPMSIKKTWVQFKNGIYDFETSEIIEPSPDYFSCNVIPWNIGELEDTPIMDKIFEEWVGKEKQQMLYEIIAFCMIPDYPLQKIFAFIGGGSNGKSCYLNLLKKCIGQDNCCSVELERLVKTFGTANLYKKLVCLMGETNFDKIDKTGKIKSLSGNDLMDFEFKGKNIFSDTNYAKLIIATNSLPTSSDKTRGFYRRWVVIPFEKTFSEKKDILASIPEQEYSNLCKKCLRLLRKITQERCFTGEVSVEEKQKEYEKHSNPMLHFIKENCKIDPNAQVPSFEFYDRLCTYLQQRGKRVMSKKEVTLLMDEEGFEVKTIWVDNDKGETKQWKHYIGIDFVTDVTDVTGTIKSFPYIESNKKHPSQPSQPSQNKTQDIVYKENQPQDVVVEEKLGQIFTKNPYKTHQECSKCGLKSADGWEWMEGDKLVCDPCAGKL